MAKVVKQVQDDERNIERMLQIFGIEKKSRKTAEPLWETRHLSQN